MITEFIRALFSVGIPVGVSSFLLAWWALKNNYFDEVDDIKGFEQEVKRLTNSRSNKKKQTKEEKTKRKSDRKKLNPVHTKWLSFGGGFYGVVALMTYAIIEMYEVRDFISNLGGFFQILSNISLDLLIRFIIDSFMNFIAAITWPVYWMAEISSPHIWLWFIAAYAGYWIGMKFALHLIRSNT